MSNKSRGAAFEKRVQSYLESVGYKTDRARPVMKFCGPGKIFSGPNDFLGCADLIGVHPNKPTLFIQCTLGDAASRRKKLEAVPWNLAHQAVMLWERYAPGVIRSFSLAPSGDWSEHIFRLKDGEPAPCL